MQRGNATTTLGTIPSAVWILVTFFSTSLFTCLHCHSDCPTLSEVYVYYFFRPHRFCVVASIFEHFDLTTIIPLTACTSHSVLIFPSALYSILFCSSYKWNNYNFKNSNIDTKYIYKKFNISPCQNVIFWRSMQHLIRQKMLIYRNNISNLLSILDISIYIDRSQY